MLHLLRQLYKERRAYFQSKFRRTLPLAETIVDRWEKAQQLGFGKNSSIYDSAIVFGEVYGGDNVWVGPQVILDGSAASLCIGSYCHISAGVQIYTHDSVGWVLTGGKQEYRKGAVSIGSHVYIGPHCTIAAGVTIADHVVIGAQSFVNEDVAAYTAVWGQPAKPQAKIVFTGDATYELEKV